MYCKSTLPVLPVGTIAIQSWLLVMTNDNRLVNFDNGFPCQTYGLFAHNTHTHTHTHTHMNSLIHTQYTLTYKSHQLLTAFLKLLYIFFKTSISLYCNKLHTSNTLNDLKYLQWCSTLQIDNLYTLMFIYQSNLSTFIWCDDVLVFEFFLLAFQFFLSKSFFARSS